MNHKYINKNTFEIVDNVFEVDDDIAETISILNKKGYYTSFSCSGHVKDSRLYELYDINDKSIFDDTYLGYIVDSDEVNSKILLPYTFTQIYIMFTSKHDFINLPNGFYMVDNNTIEMIIDYYVNGERKDLNDIDKEIKVANRVLLEWAKSLPKVC